MRTDGGRSADVRRTTQWAGADEAGALVEAAALSGVHDERILEALSTVRRRRFVPPGMADQAYLDFALPIGHRQTTTQPSLVALMIQALDVDRGDTVLEVGTGSGYQAAVLSRLVAKVYSIERLPELAEVARANLAAEGASNVFVVTADGTLGLPSHAPYDKITVTAAFPEVPPPLADQLRQGGRLVQPIGIGGNEEVVVFEKGGDALVRRATLTGAAFVRLIGAHGFLR